ncbi:hypothetical protein NKH48_18235 [Mesorhizobium sp. M1233]|uniref:hypothetical protein n=1 Tax=Mesorhizobium sp. M1233 TaxID=2957072 RepID=UPI00333517C0
MADVEQLVWGETKGLTPGDGSDTTLTRLYAVVARMAVIARERRLDGHMQRATLVYSRNSTLERDRYNLMISAIEQVEANAWTGTALPQRAAIWELNADGSLRFEGGSPPAQATWIADPTTRSGGDFKSADGRTFQLRESDKATNDDELPYVSGYTGTSLPAKQELTGWQRKVPWILGLVGGIGFIIVALNVSHTSSSFAQAYDLLSGQQTGHVASFAKGLVLPECPAGTPGVCESDATRLTVNGAAKVDAALASALQAREALVTTNGPVCVTKLADVAELHKKSPKTAVTIDPFCLNLVGQAVRYAGEHLVVTAQTPQGYWFQTAAWWIFGWHVPTHGGQPVSLIIPLCLMMAGVVSLLVGLGLGVERKPLGALISQENRYSLALAQVTFWTILVLTSVVAIAIFNGGLVAEKMRYYAHLNVDNTSPYAVQWGFFPSIPEAIWAVLGITFASPALSALLKSMRKVVPEGGTGFDVRGADANDPSKKGVLGFVTPLVGHTDPRKASIADWFLGEDVNTMNRIDITRLQLVMITAGLLISYGQAIFASVRDLPTQDILLAVRDTSVLVPSLPFVGATMALMLAASHTTYLVAKTVESKPASGGSAGEDRG